LLMVKIFPVLRIFDSTMSEAECKKCRCGPGFATPRYGNSLCIY
jgi:hypothetical protein